VVEGGCALQVLERGDPGGKPVLFHNGTPNSRLIYEPIARLAERQGIRVICYDRPGYGGSTSQPGRTVADCAQDVRAIAAGLEIERLAV
jgi:pimeloyl-ACP methyl ester carboxylesterase